MEKIIKFKGKELKTKHSYSISNEEYEKIKEEYYKSPSIDEVVKEFKKIYEGGVKHSNITNYYVKDLMAKVQVYYNKWSIEDVFECKELVEFFISKTLENKKIFPDKDSINKKIETAIRLGGKGVASKPSNFPIKTVDMILEKYNVNNYWYDFSCGWGDRLLGALKNKCNYLGTDPNYVLVDRLKGMALDYKIVNHLQRGIIDIRPQGSEEFVQEWENKVGLAFSSPPYFYLEDYKIGNQSYKEGTSYESWKENYLRKTIQNIKRYLIDNGYFIININNFLNFDLVGDTTKIAEEEGFKLKEILKLDNIKRTNSKEGFNDNSEKILVFTKNKEGE